MQNDRNVYIVSFILFAFLVICMSFAFNSSLAIADDYHHKSKKIIVMNLRNYHMKFMIMMVMKLQVSYQHGCLL